MGLEKNTQSVSGWTLRLISPEGDAYATHRSSRPRLLGVIAGSVAADTAVHVRANQVATCRAKRNRRGILQLAVTGTFSLMEDGRARAAFTGKIAESPASGWGKFAHYCWLDFSRFDVPGRYRRASTPRASCRALHD